MFEHPRGILQRHDADYFVVKRRPGLLGIGERDALVARAVYKQAHAAGYVCGPLPTRGERGHRNPGRQDCFFSGTLAGMPALMDSADPGAVTRRRENVLFIEKVADFALSRRLALPAPRNSCLGGLIEGVPNFDSP